MAVLSTHYPVSARVKRDRWRAAVIVAVGLFMLVFIAALGASLHEAQQARSSSGKTTDEMLDGARRFIDYFYSLNSRSVEKHQFYALSMMLDDNKVQERTAYLARTNFVRSVQEANMTSYIDWKTTRYELLDSDRAGQMKVSFQGDLVVNDDLRRAWHLILYLVPVAWSAENTAGVGVVDYIDVSEEPQFKEARK